VKRGEAIEGKEVILKGSDNLEINKQIYGNLKNI
jgi:hypothetical protein